MVLMGWCNMFFSWSQLSYWNILWFWWVGITTISCLQLSCWRNFVILIIWCNRPIVSWSQLLGWNILKFWWVDITSFFLIATIMSPQLSCLLAFGKSCLVFNYLSTHKKNKNFQNQKKHKIFKTFINFWNIKKIQHPHFLIHNK